MKAPANTLYGYAIVCISGSVALTALAPVWLSSADPDFELLAIAITLLTPGVRFSGLDKEGG